MSQTRDDTLNASLRLQLARFGVLPTYDAKLGEAILAPTFELARVDSAGVLMTTCDITNIPSEHVERRRDICH
jgi:hypothetical protein